MKQFIGQTNGQPFWMALHRSKDPTTYTVLAEDSAALAGLLIGEGIRPETAREIHSLALAHPVFNGVGEILSMYIGPDDALVTIDLDLDFDGGIATDQAAATVSTLQREVRARYPMIKRLFIEAGGPPAADRATGAVPVDEGDPTPKRLWLPPVMRYLTRGVFLTTNGAVNASSCNYNGLHEHRARQLP